MLQLDIRHVARIAAAALLLSAAPGCGSSECEEFYSTYEDCGFGDVPDSDIDSCNDAADVDENCENAYTNLNACIDELDEACGYPSVCGSWVEIAAIACSSPE